MAPKLNKEEMGMVLLLIDPPLGTSPLKFHLDHYNWSGQLDLQIHLVCISWLLNRLSLFKKIDRIRLQQIP